jgi:hypothetical protein
VPFKLNAITGLLDLVSDTSGFINITIGDLRYLKLDQSVVQHVINGSPQFDEGLTIAKDKRIYMDGA